MKGLRDKGLGLKILLLSIGPWSLSPASALETRFTWLPEGRLTYQGFSVHPNRLPSYTNREVYKSFAIGFYWRNPQEPHWGINFRGLQAGRTSALERIGDYQQSPLIISIQHWDLLMERELIHSPSGFLAAIGGLGAVTDQWERTKDVYIQGVKVNNAIGLSDDGTTRQGLRTSVENLAVPLGVRWKRKLGRFYYTDLEASYSFLLDFTDFLTGSSPFSGWATQFQWMVGRRVSDRVNFFLGYFGYTNHMAAPTGQGGLTLHGGALAPEGVYALFQENEVSLTAAILGCGVQF